MVLLPAFTGPIKITGKVGWLISLALSKGCSELPSGLVSAECSQKWSWKVCLTML
jgi:hypothetical protein